MKAALVALALCTAAAAQSGGNWSITSSTLDSGGASSSGGSWKVTGTIGQPDASPQSAKAATATVAGGFWPGVVPAPRGPALMILPHDPTSVTVAWTAAAVGYKLQYSTDLETWTDYPRLTIGGAAQILWPLASGPRYYFRLKKL